MGGGSFWTSFGATGQTSGEGSLQKVIVCFVWLRAQKGGQQEEEKEKEEVKEGWWKVRGKGDRGIRCETEEEK